MQSNGRKRYLQLRQLVLCRGERGGGQGADEGRLRDKRNESGAFSVGYDEGNDGSWVRECAHAIPRSGNTPDALPPPSTVTVTFDLTPALKGICTTATDLFSVAWLVYSRHLRASFVLFLGGTFWEVENVDDKSFTVALANRFAV